MGHYLVQTFTLSVSLSADDNSCCYKFSTEETLYINYDLKDFLYDLDLYLWNDADPDRNYYYSENAGLVSEEGLKVLSPGSYTAVFSISANDVSSTFSTSYSLELDTKSA